MNSSLYEDYSGPYWEDVIIKGLQDVSELLQSIDCHSYSVPRNYEEIYHP